MLRALFLTLSNAKWAEKIVTTWPVARRMARRFVAGERAEEAIAAIRELNAQGIPATVDILGESIDDALQSAAMMQSYLSFIDLIEQEKLDAWLSVKLTALGVDIDAGLCRANLRTILTRAREAGIRVAIDMEGSHYTQRILDTIRAFRTEGFDNIRAVIQAYLYRSDEDIRALCDEGIGVRLCKGAYKEPPDIAYPRKADVDAAYHHQMLALLNAAKAGRGYPGIATHDENLIDAAKQHATEHQIALDRFEFQMLHGVRRDLQHQLVEEGYRMRVYVPFGVAWYAYFMRRLAERPANLWFFVRNLFRE
ncbi:MAG: proline dehydrogenase family protein [Anaerolineae bacterium]|nr:proline dehydrogenase family protein [Anaerolineae bacterium]